MGRKRSGLFFEGIFEAKRAIGFSNTHELIIFGDALGAAERASLNLTGAKANGQMCNGSILSFAGTMRHNASIAMGFGEQDSVDSLGK